LIDGICLSLIAVLIFILLKKGRKFFSAEIESPLPHEEGASQNLFCTVDSVKIHYEVSGKGPDILLLHGLGASTYTWRLLIPLLHEHFRVWAIDIKGFGRSDAPNHSQYDLKSQADLIVNFLKLQKVNHCVVVGNSMGGAIAAELCSQNPEHFSHLILISSAHDPMIIKFNFKKLKNFVPLLAPLVRRSSLKFYMKQLYGKGHDFTERDVDRYLAPYLDSDLNRHRAFLESFDALSDKNLINRMRNIKIPTLLVWGKSDRLVPVKFGKTLQEIMIESELIIHPTAGHHLQEEEPGWLAKKIINFVLPN
jgi:pimeloyl-ACP methyl ester carboxylesterase